MRIFVTGATGYVGSAVTRELLEAGHEVVGLARSDAAAATLTAVGAEAHRGTLDDLDSLSSAAGASDGVIHTAYKHDHAFSGDFQGAANVDRRAVEALGEALAGSDRPFVMTSGTAALKPGVLGTEEDSPDPSSLGAARIPSEEAAISMADRGVRVSVVRLPPSVHGEGDERYGFVPALINIARAKGLSATVGDGSNRWPAVHRLDAARLFRLALEAAPAGSALHGVGDEAVPFRNIAEVIGRQLDLPIITVAPEDAGDHFGWLSAFVALDVPASSALTQERLGWRPVQPALIPDLEQGHYFTD